MLVPHQHTNTTATWGHTLVILCVYNHMFFFSLQVTDTSGKISTVPTLFLEHSLQIENKHQIVNVHTQLELFDTYFGQVLAVSGLKLLGNRYIVEITTVPRLLLEHSKLKTNQIMNLVT